tara:strand:+ start:10978 stop:11541 length:564 start_codon:yes stop_codon:yes gene_type:complete
VKKTALLITVLSVTGCTSMTDMMDGASGLGKLSVDQNSFDNETTISLTPDTLYDPEASIFSPVSARMGAVWISNAPNFVNLAFQQDGGYVKFEEVSFKVNGETKAYNTGLSDLDFDRTKLSGMKSTAYALMPIADFKELLNAETCQMKIEKDTGYELADCKLDRIPGGKKTAIAGLRKVLASIEETK